MRTLTLLAIATLLMPFAPADADETAYCTAEVLSPASNAHFTTGGSLTYPVFFSTHHSFIVNNPPLAVEITVSGNAKLLLDNTALRTVDVPSPMPITDWPSAANAFTDIQLTNNVYISGHIATASSLFSTPHSSANAGQQITFSISMF